MPPSQHRRPAPAGARKKPIKRGELCVDVLVAGALRVLERDGLEGFTMRAVAQELGVAPMSAYNHVGGKDELLALAFAAVARDRVPLELGEDGWEAAVRRWLHSQWQMFRAYPGLAAWMMSRPDFGVPPESHAEWLDFFRTTGFDDDQAELAWSFIQTYMLGRQTVEARMRGAAHGGGRGGRPSKEYVDYGIDAVIAGIAALRR